MRESERFGLWAPVFLGLGILAYFSLPLEPAWGWAALLALAAFLAQWRLAPRPLLRLALIAAGLAALGFALAGLRVSTIDHSPLTRELSYGILQGTVSAVSREGEGRLRVDVEIEALEHVPDPPRKVRVTYRGSDLRALALRPGDRIEGPVKLWPNSLPAAPGGFDYGRVLWFEGIGAGGVMLGAPEIQGEAEGILVAARRALHALRQAIGARVLAVMSPDTGAVAVALMTGERAYLPEEVEENLRASGLAHVLAISGLHMALLTGALFGGLRLLMALVPRLALHYPVKKWAAALALAGAAAYLVISGMSTATQRAFIMIALVLLSLMLDRPAMTMRNVALAAFALLVLRPESVLSAGFQMSFAAVTALVAVYETRAAQLNALLADWRARGPLQLALLYGAGLLLTSFIAGLATAPFAAFHFNRVAAYGLAGNLLAMPLVALLVMPFAVAAFALMPFGLEAWPLAIMELGLEGLLAAAATVAAWPGAVRGVPGGPEAALGLVTLGGLWLALWKGRVRFAGSLFLAGGLLLWALAPRPDILISENARLIAVRGEDGKLILNASRPAFQASIWLREEGDTRSPRAAAEETPWRCDGLSCLYEAPGAPRIAHIKDERALLEDCPWADIIVMEKDVGWGLDDKACHARLVLDYGDLSRTGTQALYWNEGKLTVETVRGVQGIRPWTRPW